MRSVKTVLIIEDEIILQNVYKMILEAGGYNVHTASNGIQGITKIKETKPDLVLLDMFMPVMDGRELLRNIDLDDFPDIKIIVFSNLSDRTAETEMIELGAKSFILKSSLTPADLLATVNDHLAKK